MNKIVKCNLSKCHHFNIEKSHNCNNIVLANKYNHEEMKRMCNWGYPDKFIGGDAPEYVSSYDHSNSMIQSKQNNIARIKLTIALLKGERATSYGKPGQSSGVSAKAKIVIKRYLGISLNVTQIKKHPDRQLFLDTLNHELNKLTKKI